MAESRQHTTRTTAAAYPRRIRIRQRQRRHPWLELCSSVAFAIKLGARARICTDSDSTNCPGFQRAATAAVCEQ